MKRRTVALVFSLALAGCAAADFQAGKRAAERHDYISAREIWRPLAAQGHPDAQYRLGGLYENGEGIKQDFAEAAKWYRLAAEQGLADAQLDLGALYENGEGVEQDDAQAADWYGRAGRRPGR